MHGLVRGLLSFSSLPGLKNGSTETALRLRAPCVAKDREVGLRLMLVTSPCIPLLSSPCAGFSQPRFFVTRGHGSGLPQLGASHRRRRRLGQGFRDSG